MTKKKHSHTLCWFEIPAKKMNIGPHGFIAHIQDTEGNKIGIHSKK